MNTSVIEATVLAHDQPPTHAATDLTVRSHGRTEVGPVRPNNEDHFFIAELGRTMWVRQTSLAQPATQHGQHRAHVFLVADGMGGHKAGELASALTVATLESFVLNALRRFSNLQPAEEGFVSEELRTALEEAHARILQESTTHPENAGMGTTLTMALESNGRLFVVHAGDSRCYLFREGELKQLTSDHTIVAELIKQGVLSPQNAARHSFRHVVTNAVGGTHGRVNVEIRTLAVQPGDTILLCSDGLTDVLCDQRIAAILRNGIDPRLACDLLVNEALAQGARDNITAIVAVFDPFGL